MTPSEIPRTGRQLWHLITNTLVAATGAPRRSVERQVRRQLGAHFDYSQHFSEPEQLPVMSNVYYALFDALDTYE